MAIRILIADDHAIVRDGLKMILETDMDMAVVGNAADGNAAISQAEALQPDVILMDISMPALNGIEACRTITQKLPGTRVIMLSMHNTHEHVFRSIRAGAKGYLLKESLGSEVITAIQTVMNGKSFLGAGIELPSRVSIRDILTIPKGPLDSLSDRERQILQHVVEGRTSAEIATILDLSAKSVETYRSRLMKKLNITNIPTLVKFALQQGITPTS
ncbi:response regulator transcription factor [Geobacter pelophilus]|uniref:Response regulator transcription factor n=1 Tax=Geoanaerobacter pelophilus TaxID=60036 RepID=A0AAW4L668_9BACT|nr:response regulator transcription factor [Geoanaerobacter pelophilus]MBT0665672.1 response regulator transcription factor [Geoanaerobacter pelophilus]